MTVIPLSSPNQIFLFESSYNERTVLFASPLDLSIFCKFLKLESKRNKPCPTEPIAYEESLSCIAEKIDKSSFKESKGEENFDTKPDSFKK